MGHGDPRRHADHERDVTKARSRWRRDGRRHASDELDEVSATTPTLDDQKDGAGDVQRAAGPDQPARAGRQGFEGFECRKEIKLRKGTPSGTRQTNVYKFHTPPRDAYYPIVN